VFDLSACEYLDSTFLGCLMDVYRRFGRTQPQRYLHRRQRGAAEETARPDAYRSADPHDGRGAERMRAVGACCKRRISRRAI
jgi:hypothetical protein